MSPLKFSISFSIVSMMYSLLVSSANFPKVIVLFLSSSDPLLPGCMREELSPLPCSSMMSFLIVLTSARRRFTAVLASAASFLAFVAKDLTSVISLAVPSIFPIMQIIIFCMFCPQLGAAESTISSSVLSGPRCTFLSGASGLLLAAFSLRSPINTHAISSGETNQNLNLCKNHGNCSKDTRPKRSNQDFSRHSYSEGNAEPSHSVPVAHLAKSARLNSNTRFFLCGVMTPSLTLVRPGC